MGTGAFDALALFARNELTRTGLHDAAVRRELTVIPLGSDPESVLQASASGVAFRAPGGLIAQAQRLGTTIRLFGPTAEWFVSLGAPITGRSWSRVNPPGARAMLRSRPAFIKLADAKRRDVPARRYADVAAFDMIMGLLGNAEQLELLATTGWF